MQKTCLIVANLRSFIPLIISSHIILNLLLCSQAYIDVMIYNISMLKNFSLPFLAFLQMTGLVIYVIFIASFFTFIGPSFKPNMAIAEFFAPIIMLLLFIISAVISASLVLGRAAILFWEKKYKESFKLIFWDIVWGFTYFSIFVGFLVFIK